jgi:hypothetical protein
LRRRCDDEADFAEVVRDARGRRGFVPLCSRYRAKFDCEVNLHLKNILKNSLLTLIAMALSLLVAETALRIEGRYNDLVKQALVPSPAIWEPAANQIEFRPHPDLNVPIEIRFDKDGIRNHAKSSTREKRNIIGFFGDSFVENRRVEDRFSFTSILDVAGRPGARIVNYGVDGYGLDQSYLRYKKYENHDIHDVVYVFCENDLRNLYETGLTELTDKGDIAFISRKTNLFYHLIGRFRITYLVISAYYKLRELAYSAWTGKWEWKSLRSERFLPEDYRARSQDQYADAITTDFLSGRTSPDTLRLSEKFLILLRKWKREVEASNRTFSVLVLPRKIDDAVATKLFRNFDVNVVHSIGYFENCENWRFRNDGHWNEHGNEKVAELIMSDERFPFHKRFKMVNIAKLNSDIDIYYKKLSR